MISELKNRPICSRHGSGDTRSASETVLCGCSAKAGTEASASPRKNERRIEGDCKRVFEALGRALRPRGG